MGDRDLLSEHLPMLYRTAWTLTGNEADAQDLAHDAMVSALTSLGRFRSEARLSTWLTAILINRYRTWLRAGAVRTAAAPIVATPVQLDPAGQAGGLEAAEEKAALERALDRLDDEERLLVALAFYQGRDSTEIGGLLGRPAGTVRYQLHLVREKLKTILLENKPHDRPA
jgi:RNA polymerase sigma-70 factor (ECF subfamily)